MPGAGFARHEADPIIAIAIVEAGGIDGVGIVNEAGGDADVEEWVAVGRAFERGFEDSPLFSGERSRMQRKGRDEEQDQERGPTGTRDFRFGED
jgi:hypothetical protein